MNEREIKGLLIDIDGVIYDDEEIIPDSVYAIRWLQQRKIPFRFATNATARSRASLARRLRGLGVEVGEDQVINTPFVAARELKSRPSTRCMLLVKDDARQEFEGVTAVERDA
ncbi:MAG: hypothetical protein L0170_11815, partial [Acidobacteria bacterium]|nr:hypothetical protein [Acidobacteriota bacterium]